jgi:hypothetical protein
VHISSVYYIFIYVKKNVVSPLSCLSDSIAIIYSTIHQEGNAPKEEAIRPTNFEIIYKFQNLGVVDLSGNLLPKVIHTSINPGLAKLCPF